MQMRHGEFLASKSMRESLKRGRARQALTTASEQALAPERLFDLVMDARPNAKSAKRLLARAKRRAGVTNVSASPCGKRFLLVGRYVKAMMFQKPDELLEYSDTVITYIGVRLQARRAGMSIWAAGVSFGKHALERFVERSDVDFHAPILPHVDAEAKQIFRSWENEEVIPERDGQHYRAMKQGTWSGYTQHFPMEHEWGRFVSGLPRLPMFCARTFLSDEEMSGARGKAMGFQDRLGIGLGPAGMGPGHGGKKPVPETRKRADFGDKALSIRRRMASSKAASSRSRMPCASISLASSARSFQNLRRSSSTRVVQRGNISSSTLVIRYAVRRSTRNSSSISVRDTP